MITRVRHFLSPNFPDIEIHKVWGYLKVTQEGPREHLFWFVLEERDQKEVNMKIYYDLVGNM